MHLVDNLKEYLKNKNIFNLLKNGETVLLKGKKIGYKGPAKNQLNIDRDKYQTTIKSIHTSINCA